MPPKSGKKEQTINEEELFRGNVFKKAKLMPQNPMLQRVGIASVFIPNMNINQICDKLYNTTEKNPVKTEIKSYIGEVQGESRCYFGEYCFEEIMSTKVVIIFEKEKIEELEQMLKERFPMCTYVIKKSK